ncbi:MAG: DUF6328 family protein [Acidimicrobiales bacterium]
MDDLRNADREPGDVEEQFRSLLEGLRTTLPGVQLITAFLLTLPFYDRFSDLVSHERVAYYVAFTSALIGTLLLMAPSAHQRLRADDGVARQSPRHLLIAVRITVVGTLALLVSVAAVAYLVASVVLNTPTAILLSVTLAAVGGWSWFYLPLVRFERDS